MKELINQINGIEIYFKNKSKSKNNIWWKNEIKIIKFVFFLPFCP